MLKKLWTILMGLFRKSGEAVIDKNFQTLIDQQIHNANDAIANSKTELVNIKAKMKIEQRKDDELTTKIQEYSSNIEQLLAKTGDQRAQETAMKVAQKIAELETNQADIKAVINRYDTTITKIGADIAKSETAIKDLERRRDTASANESLIKTTSQISSINSGRDSEVNQALDSLARKEKQQAEQLARFDAAEEYAEETSGDSLDRELQALNVKAGGSTAESVLERFKQKAAPAVTE
jgi:phage shock protein A